MGHQGLPGCWLSALLEEKLEDMLASKRTTKPKNTTESKSNLLSAEKSKKLVAKPATLKSGSEDKQTLEIESTAKSLPLKEKLLKVWDLREDLDLILPGYHLFKYKIPTDTVDRVLSLRKRDGSKII